MKNLATPANFILNDGGRLTATGQIYPGHDCMIRTCANAFGVSYDVARDFLFTVGQTKTGMPYTHTQFAIESLANHLGYTMRAFMPKKQTNMIRFIQDYPVGTYLISQRSHICVVIDGRLYDDMPTFGRHVKLVWQIFKKADNE